MVNGYLYLEWIMVDNDDYHFKFFRSYHNESSVDAKHTDKELHVVKEKVRNYGKMLEA